MSRQATEWDQRYQTETYLYGTSPNDFLVDYFPCLKTGDRVLCLAEGEGRNAVYLAQQGFVVTALDISSAGIRKGQALAQAKGVKVTWIRADLTEYSIAPDYWAAIIAIFMHFPSLERQLVFQKIKMGLTPGGYFLGEFYRKEQIQMGTGGPQHPDLLYNIDTLRGDLSGLEIVHLAAVNRNVIEGIGHTGMAAVVQGIARKPELRIKG